MKYREVPFVLLAVGLLLAVPARADDDAIAAEIKAAKTALDQAFQSHDIAAIESMVTSDHLAIAVAYGKSFTTAEEIATIDSWKAEYYDFSPSTVTILGPDAAMITFENSYRGTFDGHDLPKRVFVSETWLRQDGKWRQQFYQETPIDPK